MIPILDWIFEGIVGWVSSIASQLLDAVSGLFLEALGTDMTAMEEYFPFVTKAYGVMQVTAYAILILIVLWQLFRAFGGPITEAENPWHLVVRGAIFGFLIGYAKPIFSACLTIARAPYTSLMDLSMTGEDFTFAGVEQALTNGLTTLVATASVVGLILILILLIALGWNYFKLLLETVERYIVVGVLCYTSPLAFSMGASKSTNNVFKSWCRMVGSQLLLLVMNVWFLRGFASSMGHFIGNGGALTTGKGSIFLWMFCALAYLKCAQRFDSYLASMGLNVAQTGSSMGMELLMAARVISGVGSGARSAGSVFGRAGGSATATGTGAAATGFAAGFASRFSPNSYVRDAVVEGGTRMGFSGGAGFVGRAFGGIAARNGATLNGQSISSVASRAPGASGTIAGDIADRSLSNYMPHMQGFQMKGTQITGGRISTTATTPDGKKANVDMYSASQFEKPDAPHSVVTASDGSQWYQMASGEGRGAFYDAPVFGGMNAQASGGVNSDAVNPTPGESAAGTEAPGVHTDASGAPAGENIVPGAEGVPQSIGEFPGDQTHIVPGASEGIQPEGIIPGGAEVPGVQNDATGAPVSEGIVPGSDAMPQGVATFPGDQMHETAGMSEGIVPGGIHMPEAGGEDSVPGMVGQQLEGGQLGVMPSADPANIGEQIHVPDAEGQVLGAAVVAAAGADMAPSELGGDAGDIPHPVGTLHGEGVPVDGMEVPQTGSGFMPEFVPNQIPGDNIAGAGEMPSVSGGEHIISAPAEGGMEIPQTGSGFVPELAGQTEVPAGIGGADMPGVIPGEPVVPASNDSGMEAPEFGAAFVAGADSDGNIISFPGGNVEMPVSEGMAQAPEAVAEMPETGSGFTPNMDTQQPAFGAGIVDGNITAEAIHEGGIHDQPSGTMDAPEFGAAFVGGAGSDGNIIAFPGGTGEVAVPAGDSVIPDAANAGTEVPQFGAAFVSGSGVPGEMPAFTGSVAEMPASSEFVPGGTEGVDQMPYQAPGFVGSDVSGAGVHPEAGVIPGSSEMPDSYDTSVDAPQAGAGISGGFHGADHGAGYDADSFHEGNQYGGHSVHGDDYPGYSGGFSHGGYAEAPLVAATFPSAQEGTMLRTVGDGVIEASSPDGGNTLWYNSAYYQEPDAPHSVMEAANGVQWYAMQPQAHAPQFESGAEAAQYNQAAFQNFMPGYEGQVAHVDGTHRLDGHFEVRNADGSGTAFYDTARYAAPRGDYQVLEDARGAQWYAIRGEAAVDRKPVYENGQAVYDDGKLRTVSVETVRYKQTPARFAEPQKRGDIDRKPPRRKQ